MTWSSALIIAGSANRDPMMMSAAWELVTSYQICSHGRRVGPGSRRGGTSFDGEGVWEADLLHG